MDTLAAMCIHRQVQALHAQGLQTLQDSAGMPLATRVDRLLDTLVDGIAREAPMWAALFMLERKVSAPEPFRRPTRPMYSCGARHCRTAIRRCPRRPSPWHGCCTR